jgi:hypothetical protein
MTLKPDRRRAPAMQVAESLADYLVRRERQLIHQISALKGELARREQELAQIRTVRTDD